MSTIIINMFRAIATLFKRSMKEPKKEPVKKPVIAIKRFANFRTEYLLP